MLVRCCCCRCCCCCCRRVSDEKGKSKFVGEGKDKRALAGGTSARDGPHYIRNSRKPRTSTRPVPFRAHSPCTSAWGPDPSASPAARNRPPGITIFPALPRGRGNPAALRSLLVNRRGAGTGTGGGDGDGDGEEMGLREAVSDNAGVSASSASPSPSTSASASMSASVSCTTVASPRTVPRRVRFAALVLAAETSEDPDSSKERLGERCSRSRVYKPGGSDGTGGGEADRELGRGMSAGVGGAATGMAVAEDPDCRGTREVRRGRDSGFGAETGTGSSLLAEVEAARERALLAGLEEGLGEGRSCGNASAGSSDTSGRPECGPRRLRMEEKCSQSW